MRRIAEQLFGAKVPALDHSQQRLADDGVSAAVDDGLVLTHQLVVGCVVPDVALDHHDAARLVGVAHEFDRNVHASRTHERLRFISDVTGLLNHGEHLPAFFDVRDRDHFPKFFAQKLDVRVPEQFLEIRVDVFDLPGICVQQQDAVSCGFEQAAITDFGGAQLRQCRSGQ